jgi:hypothetical protein
MNKIKIKNKKTVWNWHKNRNKRQWNRIKDPETKPHSYSNLIFNKGAKNIHRRKDNFFNFKWCWEKWVSICKRLKLELTSHPEQKSTPNE